MTVRINTLIVGIALAIAGVMMSPERAEAQTARQRYERAQERDHHVRTVLDDASSSASAKAAALTEARKVIVAYDSLVRRFPISGYSDNALSNGADLATLLFERFGDTKDRATAIRLYARLASEYPASSLIKRSEAVVARLEQEADAVVPALAVTSASTSPAATPAPMASGRPRLRSIDRTVLPGTVRVTLALDREVPYHEETLAGPARVFFDLKGVEAAPDLVDAVLRYPTAAVRQIRVGRHPNSTVRVVLDLEGVSKHSVYTLYNPFRLVVDCETTTAAAVAANTGSPAPARLPATPTPLPAAPTRTVIAAEPPVKLPPITSSSVASSSFPQPMGPRMDSPLPREIVTDPPPVAGRPTVPPAAASPAPESANANRTGGFSIARQLGLGVSRIVIDPGHGGHDPGAQVKGLDEAALTLDIALRLEKLLQEEAGIDVVLTRRTNVYVPLEERTAIANREEADLFLSIHANASRNTSARGVETYFLSFASSPDAEAVAARENSANAGEMRKLPDIVKAIALNSKLDESRDLATMVQEALVTRLRRSNKDVRNLGVKKAPFVVLIGAGMPSVLAEVSFLTNKQELVLLKSAAYKQRIAEALHAAVMRYKRSLKGQAVAASQ
jgi:N-acetylmuramoyl-L-alanine amidase